MYSSLTTPTRASMKLLKNKSTNTNVSKNNLKNPCSHESNIYKYTADYTTNTNVNAERKTGFHFPQCALCSAVVWFRVACSELAFTLRTALVTGYVADYMDLELISEDARH